MAKKKTGNGNLLKTDKEVATYDPSWNKMIIAIGECYTTDAVKAIRDKALALEVYAREALNIEAEQKAIEIRIRAERRAGQLLIEMERGKPGRKKQSSPTLGNNSAYADAKKTANISDHQADRWQKLAAIPHADFENKLHDPLVKPSTTGLIGDNGPRQLPPKPLAFWGTLRDFKRAGFLDEDINELISGCIESKVYSEVIEIVPLIRNWFNKLKEGELKWEKAETKKIAANS